jgi:DNA-binding CsgD family transcriptional regulator
MNTDGEIGPTPREIWLLRLDATRKKGFAFSSGLAVVSLSLDSAVARLLKGLRPRLALIEGYPDAFGRKALAQLKAALPSLTVFFVSQWETVQDMHSWNSRRVLETLQPHPNHPQETYNNYRLSRRELEILKLLVEGMITKEIAEALSISYHTVDQHQRRIFKKMNVHTRSAAVAKALIERVC